MTLLDSNILIYHLNGVLPSHIQDAVEVWITEGAGISVITRMEILGYPNLTSAEDRAAQKLLAHLIERSLTEPIVERTIRLRQQRRIRLPDAVIAATALEADTPLVTRNADDFRDIDELTIVNPFEAS